LKANIEQVQVAARHNRNKRPEN